MSPTREPAAMTHFGGGGGNQVDDLLVLRRCVLDQGRFLVIQP
ncbi:MAG: hypothetical protein R3B07_34655 [Polyangiaceae bacterium]